MSPLPPAALRELFAERLADDLSSPLPRATARHIEGPLALPGKVTAVIGMRRAGKTTLLHQIRRDRLLRGIDKSRLPYVNFEDERLAGLAAGDLHLLVEEYYRRFPAYRGKRVVTWCFDEIQVIPGWERFIRRLLDTERVELFLSGSSAALLSREIATQLRGRAWEVVLHPFGFGEYLLHHGQKVPAGPWSGASRSRMEGAMQDYLVCGGFPEVQGLPAPVRRRLLNDYVDVAMLRDVVERHDISNVTVLRWMVRHLLGSPAAQFSVEKFYHALKSQGLTVAKDTVHGYLGHLEDCFLVRTVWMESASERQRMVNPRKIFPVDPGLIPVFDRAGRPNTGHALETIVRIELERRGRTVTYVRTSAGHQVDFLARDAEGRRELIQVCADIEDPVTRTREVRALLEAARDYPDATRRLITLAAGGAGDVPADIALTGAAAWCLER